MTDEAPIHLTGEHADRMSDAERAVVVAKIRKQMAESKARACACCGHDPDGWFVLDANNLCPDEFCQRGAQPGTENQDGPS